VRDLPQAFQDAGQPHPAMRYLNGQRSSGRSVKLLAACTAATVVNRPGGVRSMARVRLTPYVNGPPGSQWLLPADAQRRQHRRQVPV
jgi:hypothetical protein